ncbi:discoidin domain-containing protein [Paenibacillus donghaensis]|uniref:Glycoside hydrolase family 2 n=1 Tax=Paenibacillus donghaensis TaxID=414771 RepID=A0A2Z2KF85_9BACL|nr:discoidin domain-containing protein [Paenibacillus donghaensis]ASA20759.1 glycoside hydrolase family 2 [Paenibacillus donghaensis]
MYTIQQDHSVVILDGMWRFALDPQDAGEQGKWYEGIQAVQQGSVQLPGTLSGNGIGESEQWEEGLSREAVRSLRQRHRYIGAAWYECEVIVPAGWAAKQLNFYFERVMFESALWVNGKYAGRQDSLSVPHQFDVTSLIVTGSVNRITVRIDNRDIHRLGAYPSAYTDETQTIWNGMIGKLELWASEAVRMAELRLYPDADNRRMTITGTWTNELNEDALAMVEVVAITKSGSRPHRVSPREFEFRIPARTDEAFRLDYDLGADARLWDEFEPHVYELQLHARINIGGEWLETEQSYPFGLRSIRSVGNQIQINGRNTLLRGTLECCIFPLTGHPPMDQAPWTRLFQIAKDYGLNHIRFHSWCPPEAAFDAADRLGIYVQAEGPVWMDTWNMPVGAHPEHYAYLPEEARRIVAAYGSHPSFCIFSNGNELNGDFNLLHQIAADLKASDEGRLYTLTTNWDRPLDPADDLFCAQTVDGTGARGQYFPEELAAATTLDFRSAIAKSPVPLITHEVGQYTVYPDVDEIESYSGVLRPVNLEAIKEDLLQKGMLGDIRKFVRGSGMLALQLYRDEIEAALRTPGLGGFQLLDLHDFPGQSTATVGILNAFWESKGLVEPEAFRQFCAPTVLLLRMPKRIYISGETFRASVDIAHFGSSGLPASDVEWTLAEESGRVLGSGIMRTGVLPCGSGLPIGEFETDALKEFDRNARLIVSLAIPCIGIRNEWPIWVYAVDSAATEISDSSIHVTDVFDEETERRLQAGDRVLFLAASANLIRSAPGKFYPVFWSSVHFSSENPCGIVVRHEHPAFQVFPTLDYAEYPWQDLLDRSVSVVFTGDDPFDPIVQVIPNFYHNRKMSNLFEYRVGQGRLLVCGIDIQQDLADRPAALALRQSLTGYMRSDAFRPNASIQIETLRELLNSRTTGQPDGWPVLTGGELAIGKEALSDSSLEAEHSPSKGNDGIEHTKWLAADEVAGHWWQVDLGKDRIISGTRVKFHQPGNFLYVIQVSSDGHEWKVMVNQTGQTSTEQIRTDRFNVTARYVRIVYNGLPASQKAGHYHFEVYGK